MLLVLAGSSGSGKSAIRHFLLEDGAPLVAGLALRSHDFDENGVPVDADTGWRQRNGEVWIERALAYAKRGEHLLLSANWPLGEVLASPSAPLVDGIALCLIDCSDTERVERLRARQHPSYTDRHIWEFVLFAAWQRLHHADPAWMPEVIVGHWSEIGLGTLAGVDCRRSPLDRPSLRHIKRADRGLRIESRGLDPAAGHDPRTRSPPPSTGSVAVGRRLGQCSRMSPKRFGRL